MNLTDIMLLREGFTVQHGERMAVVKKVHYRDGFLTVAYLDTEEKAVVKIGEVQFVPRKSKR